MSILTTYNGYTNYETWNVALWIDNDEGSYNFWRDRAQTWAAKPSTSPVWTRKESAR